MKVDHNLSGEAAPCSRAREQAGDGRPHPNRKSRDVRGWLTGWLLIATIGLGALLTAAWTLWLGYGLVRGVLWLFS